MGYSKLTYEEYIEHLEVWGISIPKWANELSAKGYKGISAIDFYDDIFGDDLEEERMPDDYVTGEYAAIAIEKVPKMDREGNLVYSPKGEVQLVGRRTTITKGNMELYDLIDRSENFCILAPISYAGRTRKNDNARFMYALCIEVDYIQEKGGIDELIYSWERKNLPVPKPTYIVCSGNGLHLYYVFEKPIPLWKNIFESLTEYKKYITPRLWTKYITSAYEKIEYESINQPFRIVGTRTKGESYTMAFQVGEKVSIEYMNKFVPEDMKLSNVYKSQHSLEEAKKLYPTWYEERIVKGREKGVFNRHQPIYYNWIEKILKGAVVGKRYNCLENLCSLAVQCQIEPEQVEKDCYKVAEYFETLTVDENNHFTEYDVLCALRTYHFASYQAYNRRIEFISKKTGITLTPNKRNHQRRNDHLEEARAVRDVRMKRQGRAWDENNGRKPKADIVIEWRKAHPDEKKADCIRDTGLTKPTVYKWWDGEAASSVRKVSVKKKGIELNPVKGKWSDADLKELKNTEDFLNNMVKMMGAEFVTNMIKDIAKTENKGETDDDN